MEHVILLDEAGQARGTRDKRTVHTGATPLHLAFSCYVFDPAGRFLVTRRALGKLTWPGIWTNSFCGHPQAAETMTEAIRRRAAFELGLVLDEVRLVLPDFRYRAEHNGVVENEMCPVYYAASGAEPEPHPDEVDAVRWLPWSEFLREASAHDSAYSPWCRLQAPLLAGLGPVPARWPAADPSALPPAARRSAPC
jgi:isopentenyl-diphosphate delta-isomerase